MSTVIDPHRMMEKLALFNVKSFRRVIAAKVAVKAHADCMTQYMERDADRPERCRCDSGAMAVLELNHTIDEHEALVELTNSALQALDYSGSQIAYWFRQRENEAHVEYGRVTA